MVTADAKSMYTKIDTEHGLKVLQKMMKELQEEGELPHNFSIEMSLDATSLVISLNLFEYGDSYLKQVDDAAMDTLQVYCG